MKQFFKPTKITFLVFCFLIILWVVYFFELFPHLHIPYHLPSSVSSFVIWIFYPLFYTFYLFNMEDAYTDFFIHLASPLYLYIIASLISWLWYKSKEPGMTKTRLTIIITGVLVILLVSTLHLLIEKKIERLPVVSSLEEEASGYFLYDDTVYFSQPYFAPPGPAKLGEIVVGADAETFTQKLGDYGTDKDYVYCKGKKIEGSDGLSFNNDDPNYAFDKYQAYYSECHIIEGADGATFKVTQWGVRAEDKNHVYVYGGVVENKNLH